jgi:2-deoxy-D-gluconate 3-dehydrogenase
MRTLAAEWAPYGIRCNAIAPTFTRTPLLEAALAVNPAFAASTATVPLGRIAEPADIAGAVVFLASPAAAMITGQHLAVDGGFTAI